MKLGIAGIGKMGAAIAPRLRPVLRPWLWLCVFRLARNTKIASDNLCAWLRESALTNTIVPGTITEHNS